MHAFHHFPLSGPRPSTLDRPCARPPRPRAARSRRSDVSSTGLVVLVYPDQTAESPPDGAQQEPDRAWQTRSSVSRQACPHCLVRATLHQSWAVIRWHDIMHDMADGHPTPAVDLDSHLDLGLNVELDLGLDLDHDHDSVLDLDHDFDLDLTLSHPTQPSGK